MSVYFAKSLAEEDVVFTEALEPDLCEFAGGDVGSNTVCFGTLGVGLGGGLFALWTLKARMSIHASRNS